MTYYDHRKDRRIEDMTAEELLETYNAARDIVERERRAQKEIAEPLIQKLMLKYGIENGSYVRCTSTWNNRGKIIRIESIKFNHPSDMAFVTRKSMSPQLLSVTGRYQLASKRWSAKAITTTDWELIDPSEVKTVDEEKKKRVAKDKLKAAAKDLGIDVSDKLAGL